MQHRITVSVALAMTVVIAVGGAAVAQRAPSPRATGPRVTMEDLHRHGGVPAGWRFTLPAGDVAAGKEVFARFDCNSCHAAGADFPSPPPDPGRAGPDLSGMGPHHPAEYFAESIIAPNAVIVEGPGYTGPDGRSIMPDFRDSMSVADLVNVVAYLKSLGGSSAGGHEHHMAGMESQPTREQTVDGLRVSIEYDDPDEHPHAGTRPGVGHLMVKVTDAQSGQPVPYLPLQATLYGASGPPRLVRLTPMLDEAGFHYGVDVTVRDDTERVVVRIGPSALRIGGSAPRLDRARTVTIPWSG